MLVFPVSGYGTYARPTKVSTVEIRYLAGNSLFGNFTSSLSPGGHVRSGHSSNKVRFLDSITPWRNPSGYGRSVWLLEELQVGTHKVGNAPVFYAKSSPIRNADVQNILTWGAKYNSLFNAGPSPVATSPYVINTKAKALTKALSDLASNKAGMGENLAQLSSTVDSLAMVGNDVLNIVRALRGLRRGRVKDILNLNVKSLKRLVRERKVDRRVASYWLTYWYGFKPLYSDGAGLIEIIKDLYDPVLLVHGRGRAFEAGHANYTAPSPDSYFTPITEVHDQYDYRCMCNLTGKVRKHGEVVRALNRAGLVNPVSLIWELIPFSFVVDWVVPVGETLAALSAPIGLDFVGGSFTERWERDALIIAHSSAVMTGTPAMSAVRSFGFNRTIYGAFPKPQFYEKTFFTGASRWATIAALLSNVVKDIRGH